MGKKLTKKCIFWEESFSTKKAQNLSTLQEFGEGKVKHEVLRNYVTRCQISVSGRQDLIVRGLFSWKIKGSSFCTIMY